MPLGASYSHFVPDAKLMFRNTGQPLVVGNFVSAPLELARLRAQWRVNEIGQHTELPVWINVTQSVFSRQDACYRFSLEAAVYASFAEPAIVALYEFTKYAVNPFEIIMTQMMLEDYARYATHLRLVMNTTPGADGIQFCAFPRGDTPRM